MLINFRLMLVACILPCLGIGCNSGSSNNANNKNVPANAASTPSPISSPIATPYATVAPQTEISSEVEDISVRLWEGAWHSVYLTNVGSKNLNEVKVSVTVIGENGDQATVPKYYALWTPKQEQEFSFENAKSPKNVQKVIIKGTSQEGAIDLAYTPRNITISVVNEDCSPSDLFVDWGRANPSRTKLTIGANSISKLTIKTGTHRVQSCRAGTNNCGEEISATFSESTTKHTISRSASCK